MLEQIEIDASMTKMNTRSTAGFALSANCAAVAGMALPNIKSKAIKEQKLPKLTGRLNFIPVVETQHVTIGTTKLQYLQAMLGMECKICDHYDTRIQVNGVFKDVDNLTC